MDGLLWMVEFENVAGADDSLSVSFILDGTFQPDAPFKLAEGESHETVQYPHGTNSSRNCSCSSHNGQLGEDTGRGVQ